MLRCRGAYTRHSELYILGTAKDYQDPTRLLTPESADEVDARPKADSNGRVRPSLRLAIHGYGVLLRLVPSQSESFAVFSHFSCRGSGELIPHRQSSESFFLLGGTALVLTARRHQRLALAFHVGFIIMLLPVPCPGIHRSSSSLKNPEPYSCDASCDPASSLGT